MYDEISTQSADYQAPQQPPPTTPNEFRTIGNLVAEVMSIEEQGQHHDGMLVLRYAGMLMMESSGAFELLDSQLEPLGYQAHFTTEGEPEKHVILVTKSRPTPAPRPWYLNAVLVVVTVFSMMTVGAALDGVPLEDYLPFGLFEGWIYAASLLLILGAHELGHYFAARYHKVAVTLPYFLPLPYPLGFFGTLGAFIQLREPMRNRRQLFDIGVSGPLAGLVFAIPILIAGVATADITIRPTAANCEQLSEEQGEDKCLPYGLEGNSAVYYVTKYIFHGEWLPNSLNDMNANQLSHAGWTGLFVTGLNLLPLGQLDGGHVLYSVVGKRASRTYVPVIVGMAFLILLFNPAWILLFFLLLFLGRIRAAPRDDITPLDARRRVLGMLIFVILILIFVWDPIKIIDPMTIQ